MLSNEVEWDVDNSVVVTHGHLVLFCCDQFSDFLSCVLRSFIYVLFDLVSWHMRGEEEYLNLIRQETGISGPFTKPRQEEQTHAREYTK